MNIILFLITAAANDSTLTYSNPLYHIQRFTETTAVNTTFSFWDGFSIFLASTSLVFSIFTYYSQKNTSDNTKKLSQEAQHKLLLDLVRHLYRNLVITYTIKTKLIDIDFKGYPSEEHLLKLKIPMENIHLDAFYGNDKRYEVMHNLYLNLRNYNEEIDIACQHFKNPTILKEVKYRDLNTLLFKPSFLTERLLITIYELWELRSISEDFGKETYRKRILPLLKDTKTIKEVKDKILEAQIGATNASNRYRSIIDDNFIAYSNANSSYKQTLFYDADVWKDFVRKLKHDVAVERGKNDEGGDKVYIIPFA